MKILHLLICGTLLTSVHAGAQSAPPAELDQETFDATGSNSAILTVRQYGRYSLRAKSDQGTALQLVDRMMGPGETSGEAGTVDGRIDTFLDAGTYKVRLISAEKGTGEVSLSADPFTERNTAQLPVLDDLGRFETELKDFERASYWVEVTARGPVYLEAQGRALADLRLWHEGNWLMDIRPSLTPFTRKAGRPEINGLLIATLDPGWYLLTAYGGPAQAWTKEDDAYPLRIRRGLRKVDSTFRLQENVSSFGADRYVVDRANRFFLQLAEKKSFRLDIRDFATGDDLRPSQRTATIDRKSQDPECSLELSGPSDRNLITVIGAPGEPYVLSGFSDPGRFSLSALRGPHWISTIHSGSAGDRIDATGVLMARRPGMFESAILAEDVVHLGRGKPWSRRFNLLGREELFVKVEDAGNYRIRATGVEAQILVMPLTFPRQSLRNEVYTPAGRLWAMAQGYWIVKIQPGLKGILGLEIFLDGTVPSGSVPPGPAKGSVTFPAVNLDPVATTNLMMNTSGGVDWGLVARALPLPLTEALPVTLSPGQEIVLSVTCAEESRLTVDSSPPVPYTASLQGPVPAGLHQLKIRNDDLDTRLFSVKLTPTRLFAPVPRSLPPGIEDRFTRFPVLTEESPWFFDIARGASATALLQVETPGLYSLETTGLLRTRAKVRTRTRMRLFSEEENGTGRNARIQQYLKEGEYQVTVSALGSSQGHAGLRAVRTEVTEGGDLVPGREMRAHVKAGSAVVYRFQPPAPGDYRIRTVGTGKTFGYRFDSVDGWPFFAPGTESELAFSDGGGESRYMTLPRDVDTLRVTDVIREDKERTLEGHGPHELALGETLAHVWKEPAEGKARERDLYEVVIPAAADATLVLDEEKMQAHVHRKLGDRRIPVGTAPPGKGWTGRLAPGEYEIAVECGRQDDDVEYSITFSVQQLVDGISREVDVPATIPVSVDQDGVVELSSHGSVDVRARLYRGDDLVEVCDDADTDWNFRIAGKLAAGEYRLVVEPVGASDGRTRLTMSVPREKKSEAITVPFEGTISLGDSIDVLPFRAPAAGGVLAIEVSGGGLAGCVLEKHEKGGGDPVRVLAQQTSRHTSLVLPVEPGGQYQLRLWSADHQADAARVVIQVTEPATVALESLGTPRAHAVSNLAGDPSILLRAAVERAGLFRVGPLEGFGHSAGTDRTLAAPVSPLIALGAGDHWLRWTAEGGKNSRIPEVTVQLERLSLRAGADPTVLTVDRPTWLDVEPGEGSFAILIGKGTPGSPGVAVTSVTDTDPILGGRYARHDGGCVAVGPPGSTRAQVWNTVAGNAIPVTLRLSALRADGAVTPVTYGRIHRELAKSGSVFLQLPPGPKQVELDLDPGLVAFTGEPGSVEAVAGAPDAPGSARLESTASRLTIVDISGGGGFFSAAILATPGSAPTRLAHGDHVERVFPGPATLHLELDPALASSPSAVLFVTGDDVALEYVDEEGVVHREVPLPLAGRPGRLTLSTKGGLVKAWIAEEDAPLETRWGDLAAAPAQPVVQDSVIPLTGQVQTFALELAGDRVVRFEVDRGATAFLANADGRFLQVVEGSTGCRIDRFLAAGRYTLGVRGLEGAPLTGRARIDVSEVTPLGEGPGPESLIGGGESRTFSLVVREKKPIGIGLRAGSEILECELRTAEEKLVGRGIQQYSTLDPGTYLIRVSAPAGQEPVRFVPVILGIEPPGNGPPEDYVREFMKNLGTDGEDH